jgi:hypothetical protein
MKTLMWVALFGLFWLVSESHYRIAVRWQIFTLNLHKLFINWSRFCGCFVIDCLLLRVKFRHFLGVILAHGWDGALQIPPGFFHKDWSMTPPVVLSSQIVSQPDKHGIYVAQCLLYLIRTRPRYR